MALFLMRKNMASLNRIERNMGCAFPITNGRETQKERSGAQVVTRFNRKLHFSLCYYAQALINQLRAPCDSCCDSSEPATVCKILTLVLLLGPPQVPLGPMNLFMIRAISRPSKKYTKPSEYRNLEKSVFSGIPFSRLSFRTSGVIRLCRMNVEVHEEYDA